MTPTLTQQTPAPLVKVKLDSNGNSGTYRFRTTAGLVRGRIKLEDPTSSSLWDEWKALFREEILPTEPKSVFVAFIALLAPFLVVLAGPLAGDQVAFYLNVGLAGVAAFVGVIVALSSTKAAPHIKFGLTLFAAASAALLVIAKLYEIPGA